MKSLHTLVEQLVCRNCYSSVDIELSNRQGLYIQLEVKCANRRCTQETTIDLSSVVAGTRVKDINLRACLAMRMLGQGLAGLKTFCGFLSASRPVSQKIFESYNKLIMTAAEAVARDSMRRAIAKEIELTGGADLAVSGDGTWRKSGFSSFQGVSSLIGARSGLVIDTVVKNSICKICDYQSRCLSPEEFDIWKLQDNHLCTANHSDNAGKMETDAISEMFRRSIAIYQVRYIQYIGDGDSKTYKRLLVDKPYDGLMVVKKECIGHIQKRMGTQLRNLRKERGREVTGVGKLTLNYVGTLTAYYGRAIRNNCNSVDAMLRAIRAVFFHESSTDAQPIHKFCPSGPNSWCKFNQSIARGIRYDHKRTLPQEVWALIKPIFEALSEQSLLERCLGGFTQNVNESFNAKVWKLAPKKSFSGYETVRIAVALATISFNEGMEGLSRVFDNFTLDHRPEFISCLRNFDQLRARNKPQRSTSSMGPSRSILSQLEDNSDIDDECQYRAGIDD